MILFIVPTFNAREKTFNTPKELQKCDDWHAPFQVDNITSGLVYQLGVCVYFRKHYNLQVFFTSLRLCACVCKLFMRLCAFFFVSENVQLFSVSLSACLPLYACVCVLCVNF